MNKIEVNPNYKFTFDNDVELRNAEMTGYIESYDIVRVCLKLDNGNSIDFPLKSREDYVNQVNRINNDDTSVSAEFYQDKHMYDVCDYI